MTAHGKVCPVTQEMVYIGYNLIDTTSRVQPLEADENCYVGGGCGDEGGMGAGFLGAVVGVAWVKAEAEVAGSVAGMAGAAAGVAVTGAAGDATGAAAAGAAGIHPNAVGEGRDVEGRCRLTLG